MLVRDRILDTCENPNGWTVLGNDTTGPSFTTTHIMGTGALLFNKVNGAANAIYAGIKKDISTDLFTVCAFDRIAWVLYVDDTADVASAFIRLGTDASNYIEWQVADTAINSAKWTLCSVVIGNASSVVGTGWDQRNVTHLEVGVNFDSETDTGTMIVDEIFIAKAVLTQS